MGPPQYASGDLHTVVTWTATWSFQLGRSVMWVIVLHPYTEYEVCRTSQYKDMADFRLQR